MRVLKTTLLFLLLFLVIERSTGYILRQMYHKGYSGNASANTTYAIEKCDAPVLILGSSRAMHHYVPRILKDSLGVEAFNAGRDGHFMLYHRILLQHLLSKYKPRLVILDMNANEFNVKFDGKDQEERIIASLLPYMSGNKYIRQVIADMDYTQYVLGNILSSYPYNSSLISIAYKAATRSGSSYPDGYEPLESAPRPVMFKEDTNRYARSKRPIVAFEDICKLCSTENVELIVVTSPECISRRYTDIPIIRTITQKYGIPYFNFAADSSFREQHLFYDHTHLTNEGANLFTRTLLPYLSL